MESREFSSGVCGESVVGTPVGAEDLLRAANEDVVWLGEFRSGRSWAIFSRMRYDRQKIKDTTTVIFYLNLRGGTGRAC
jgi:hypothetical protein